MSRRKVNELTSDRDLAQRQAFQAQIVARQTAENWTELLVNISQRIAELNDVDKVLVFIVENARKLLKSDTMAVAIVSEQFPCLELKYYASDQKTEMVDSPVMVKNPLILDALMTARSYRSITEQQITPGEPAELFAGICLSEDQLPKNVAIAPIILDNNPIGVLWIARIAGEEYSETDLIWLECIADQVVIAIQHGLMTAQLQSLSVVEERGRIAREMHDGLAQVLGYLNLQVQTLDALQKKEKWGKLAEEITSMRQAIQTAHADVRENILSLRTTLAHETGLVPAMLKYIEEFSYQTGIETRLENEAGEALELSSIAEVQLVCILQEALTNVRKHARAKEVKVLLRKENRDDEEYIHMGIQDDGVGFSLQKSARCFGLQTMRERVTSVGGQMIIFSASGQGTQLDCRLPCLKPEQLRRKSVMLPSTVPHGGLVDVQK